MLLPDLRSKLRVVESDTGMQGEQRKQCSQGSQCSQGMRGARTRVAVMETPRATTKMCFDETYQVVALKRGRRSSRCASAHPRGSRGTARESARSHPSLDSHQRGWRGCADAEADMPLAIKPLAQGAFKTSMVHILQFTLRIAFRCVLHRYGSQDIRC